MSGLFRHPPQPQQRQNKLVQEPVAGNTISSAALTFGFSEAATLAETFSASGGVAFGFSEAAVLTERFTLSAGLSFPFSESAALSVPLDLSAALTFGWSESAQLSGPNLGGHVATRRIAPYVIARKPIHLYADLAFGFGIHARLAETDDELALVLGAF